MTAAEQAAEALLADTLKALRSAREWVEHWQLDREFGMKPTEGSMRDAHREISAAMDRIERHQTARLVARMEVLGQDDLLTALKRIMSYAHDGAAVCDVDPREQPEFVAARAAIARAEGRAP